MAEAHFLHATLYRFSNEAVQEISRRFKSRVTDLNARVWYKPEHAFFELKCSTDLGPIADEALGEIIRDFIKHDVTKAVNNGLPPPAQLFPDAEKNGASRTSFHTNTSREQAPPPIIPQLIRPPRFVIAGDLTNDGQGPVRRIRQLDDISLDYVQMHDLPKHVLQRIITSNKPSDHRRVYLGALLCDVSYDQEHGRTVNVGRTKIPKPDDVALQIVDTMGMFPRLRGHGVNEHMLPPLSEPSVGAEDGNTMARFLAEQTTDMEDPYKKAGGPPNDAEEFRLGGNVTQNTGRRRVAKIDISDMPEFEDSEDESEEEETVNFQSKANAFQGLLGGDKSAISPQSSANVVAAGAIAKTPGTGDNTASAYGTDDGIPEYDPKFGLVNKRGMLAADAKTQALWDHEHYDPSQRAPVIAGPAIVMRSKPRHLSTQDYIQQGQSARPRTAQSFANSGHTEGPPAWEKRLVRPKVKTGWLIDDTHEPVGQVSDASGLATDMTSLMMSTSGQGTAFFAPPSSTADQIVERLQPETKPEQKFNTMGQQAGKKKKKGKGTAQGPVPQLPVPDRIPSPRKETVANVPANERSIPTAQPAQTRGSMLLTEDEMFEALSAPASLTTLEPFLEASLQKHARIEVTFGLAPLIPKRRDSAAYARQQGPGWWQRTLNKDAECFRPSFIPRLTTSAQDAAWILTLSKAHHFAAEPAYTIRTRSAVNGKLENHYVYPPLQSGDSQHSRIQTYEETTLGYIHYPKMLWDAMISTASGGEGSADIQTLVASMQTCGEPPSFFAKMPEAYSELVEVQARREFEKVAVLKGTYIVVTEVQELQIVRVKSPHYNIAACCDSRQEMIDQHRLWYECRLVFEDACPGSAGVVQYFVHEFASCLDVIGLQNEGPWMATAPEVVQDVQQETEESIW